MNRTVEFPKRSNSRIFFENPNFSDFSLIYANGGDRDVILRWIARSKPDSERVRTGADGCGRLSSA